MKARPFLLKLLFGFTLLPNLLFSQYPNLRFEVFDKQSSLPLTALTACYEDSRGFLWFGTLSGLYKFDGSSLTHFQNNPSDPLSISDNKINIIKEDSKGNFWIGTQNGVNYLDTRKRTFRRFNNLEKDGIGLCQIYRITFDKNNNLWFNTSNGFYKFDSVKQKAVKISFDSHVIKTVVGFSFTKNKTFLTARDSLFVAKENFEKPVLFHVFNNKTKPVFCRDMLEDNNGIIWLQTDRGLYYIQNDTVKQFTDLGEEVIHSVSLRNKNELWVITRNGLSVVNTTTFACQKDIFGNYEHKQFTKLPISNVYHITNDIIISASTFGGLHKTDLKKLRFKNYTSNWDKLARVYAEVFEFYEYQPDILIVPDTTKGIQLLNLNTNTLSPFNYKPSSNYTGWLKSANCFLDDSDGKLWIGTAGGGLFLFDKIKKQFIDFENGITGIDSLRLTYPRRLLKDKHGNLWITTWSHGSFKIDFKKKICTRYFWGTHVNLMLKLGRFLFEDKKGILWAGTRGGLGKYDEQADTFRIYKNILDDPTSMSENTAFCIYEDDKENLWVGTYGGGLNKMDVKTGKFRHFTTENGLIDNNIMSILPDKSGNLWLSTFNGLSVFNPNTEKTINYTSENGLINEAYNAFSYGKGNYSDRFFFGGEYSIDYFNPDSIKQSTFDPKIYITDLKLFNKTVAVGKQDKDLKGFFLDEDISFKKLLTLTHEQNVISFEYTALDYSSPKTIKYAYQLLGFDTTWQYVGNQRNATFTNLNPGDYTFNVKATNSDGVWGTKQASIKLTVLPPWWRTWWFRVLLFSTFLGIFVSIYRYRLGQIKEKEDIRNALTKRIAEVKMEAVRSQMNPHFIFNALTSINLFILKNDTDTASFYLNKFSKLMRDVLDQSRADIIGLDEELNTLKIYVEIEKMRFKDNFNFIFDIDPNVDLAQVKIPPLILQPFVENAIWHGLKQRKNQDNTLIIKAFEKEGFIHIVIEDNGIGREKAMAAKQENGNGHTSHGLRLTFERLQYFNENYNTQATIETIDLKEGNQNPTGTRIIFKTLYQYP